LIKSCDKRPVAQKRQSTETHQRSLESRVGVVSDGKKKTGKKISKLKKKCKKTEKAKKGESLPKRSPGNTWENTCV